MQKGDGAVRRCERLEQIRRMDPEKDVLEIHRLWQRAGAHGDPPQQP
ncbi:hypothetical protein SNL152K_9131 [Streptomyces sp. NL15-2K]|nr:hypothetical protein SNL152K_9131 [Streptomyces sp. NL15-2K]